MSRHTDLIDAVNDAKTEYEHTRADGYLQGWRDGLTYCGRRWDFIEADQHSAARFGDRSICCGVLLDWRPAEVVVREPIWDYTPAPTDTDRLRTAGVLVVGHACKLDGSICESRLDRCSDCPAGAKGKP